MFFRKRVYDDKVYLTVGIVYFKPLTNIVVEKAAIKSTIYSDILNNALFFNLIEKSLLQLSKKKRKILSIEDGEKIRTKTRDILQKHGLLNSDLKKENVFSKEDTVWFDKVKDEGFNKLKRDVSLGSIK